MVKVRLLCKTAQLLTSQTPSVAAATLWHKTVSHCSFWFDWSTRLFTQLFGKEYKKFEEIKENYKFQNKFPKGELVHIKYWIWSTRSLDWFLDILLCNNTDIVRFVFNKVRVVRILPKLYALVMLDCISQTTYLLNNFNPSVITGAILDY